MMKNELVKLLYLFVFAYIRQSVIFGAVESHRHVFLENLLLWVWPFIKMQNYS